MTNPQCSMSVGIILRKWRKKRALSLKQVAEAAGCDHGNLSKVENGKSGISHDLLVRIAAVLGLPVSQVYAEAEAAADHPLPQANSPASNRASAHRRAACDSIHRLPPLAEAAIDAFRMAIETGKVSDEDLVRLIAQWKGVAL